MIVNYEDNKRAIKIIIIVGFKLQEEEKRQLILSKIGKDKKIREEALEKFENFKRIKEIKNFAEAETEKRKIKLNYIEFGEDNIRVIRLC